MYSMLRWPLRLLTLGRSREGSTLSLAVQQPKSTFINKMDGKKALIILAPGAEEIEFTIAADVLRRAGVSEKVECSSIFSMVYFSYI